MFSRRHECSGRPQSPLKYSIASRHEAADVLSAGDSGKGGSRGSRTRYGTIPCANSIVCLNAVGSEMVR